MSIKLLIVDDSELDAELMIREINTMDQNFDLKVVSNREDYEKEVREWIPDLIISDFNMQSFRGDEALMYAKKILPGVPFISISGSINKEMEVVLLENRANDILTKDNLKRLPFAINRVLNEIRDKEKLNATLFELAGNIRFQEALSEISLVFNSTDDFDAKVNYALRVIGETVDVSRVYIFEDFNHGQHTRNTYEWCAEGVEPEIDNLKELSYKEDLPSFIKLLEQNGVVHSSDVSTMEADMRNHLEPQGIKALMVHPIFLNNERFGFVGFDEVRNPREWNTSEVKLLRSVAGILSNAFSEQKAKEKLQQTNDELNKLLQEKELLVAEVHHRVKNNLALVSSFLQLDQMGLGGHNKEDIIQSNILRIKSIALIHEIVYQQGSFTNISVFETLSKVLTASLTFAGIDNPIINRLDPETSVTFNINQAVPFSLLLSQTIYEVNSYNKLKGLIIDTDDKNYIIGVNVRQYDSVIEVMLVNQQLSKVLGILKEGTEHGFSEIQEVLARQISAEIEVNSAENHTLIRFVYRDVKGSSSALR